MASGILVPLPGIEPGPSAVRPHSPSHYTAREFPPLASLRKKRRGVVVAGAPIKHRVFIIF